LVIRKIVQIDEELCNGCGQCIPNCAEGALQIINGKAKLLRDDYCDGLGACLGHCPQDAITIIERQADPFDEQAVHTHLTNTEKSTHKSRPSFYQPSKEMPSKTTTAPSALTNWPIQINLLPLDAPFFVNRELLIVADCVPVAYPALHKNLLQNRTVVIGCPKFDDVQSYVKKLGEIIKRNDIKSIILAHMEVPCCSGLAWIVTKAVEHSGKTIQIKRHIISIKGEIK
jgi:Pyruvate/2-oxoacid:ferredoxin oxidoreductase delta subunit